MADPIMPEPGAPDPRKVWQNQPMEISKMSVSELRGKAQQRQRKARFETFKSVVVGLILLILFAWAFTRQHEWLSRAGLGVLSLWCLYFMYQTYRWIWPGPRDPEAPLHTTLHSYRNELEKQRDYARHIWTRSGLTFCFLGLALFLAPGLIPALGNPRLLLSAAPFFALLLIWSVTFFIVRRRSQRKLQGEIDELTALENESRS
jgi:hypothetical protein